MITRIKRMMGKEGDADKNGEEPKIFFRIFGNKGTVAEPWTSAEEMLKICQKAQKKIKIRKTIPEKYGISNQD